MSLSTTQHEHGASEEDMGPASRPVLSWQRAGLGSQTQICANSWEAGEQLLSVGQDAVGRNGTDHLPLRPLLPSWEL